MNTLNLLALDSATENCSAAMWTAGKLYTRVNAEKQQHAAMLLQLVDELRAESGFELKDLDAVIYGQGPGSFTGVRVAVSAVQGLALGLNKPAAGVSSLAALAYGALKQSTAQIAVSAIDARMGEVYLGIYAKDGDGVRALAPEAVLKPADANAAVLQTAGDKAYVTAGTGIKIMQQQGLNCADPLQLYPDPCSIIELGALLVKAGHTCDAAEAQPVYIRNEVTWKKLDAQGKGK